MYTVQKVTGGRGMVTAPWLMILINLVVVTVPPFSVLFVCPSSLYNYDYGTSRYVIGICDRLGLEWIMGTRVDMVDTGYGMSATETSFIDPAGWINAVSVPFPSCALYLPCQLLKSSSCLPVGDIYCSFFIFCTAKSSDPPSPGYRKTSFVYVAVS